MTFNLPKESAPFWPWTQDRATTARIMIPMIRRIMPSIIASELVGVQSMDISNYICLVCRILVDKGPFSLRIKYTDEDLEPKKNCCPLCGNTDLKLFNIFSEESNFENIEYYRARSILTKTKEQAAEIDMIVVHKAIRPFMTDDVEPNDKYRPWLEEHVGKQKVAWDWDICRTDSTKLEIRFVNKENATLFELTWP